MRMHPVKKEGVHVFELSRATLLNLLEATVGESVTDFVIDEFHTVKGHVGYSADKLIPAFTYTTASGRGGRETLFVKRFRWAGPAEAHHYEHLQPLGAPIPRMLGHFVVGDNREILVLQYLEPLGALHPFHDFVADEGAFLEFLSVIARFNAVEPSAEYAAALPTRGGVGDLGEISETVVDIWRQAARGELGGPLKKFCGGLPRRPEQIDRLTSRLGDPISAMPLALCHNDFFPDSVARDRETGELRVIDLESVALAPRFNDVARWLWMPEDIYPHGWNKRSLAEYYVAKHVQWGGEPVSPATVVSATKKLWLAQTLSMLWWIRNRAMDGLVDWTKDTEVGRRVFRKDLLRQLQELVAAADEPPTAD